VKILETRFWEKLVEGSFWENLENKLKRRGPYMSDAYIICPDLWYSGSMYPL
jgi:hypothetical protein